MAVHAGGALDQHPPDLVGHESHSPGGEEFGDITVNTVAGTRVAGLLGPTLEVACHHHQSVRTHPASSPPRTPATGPWRPWRPRATGSGSRCSGTPRRRRPRPRAGLVGRPLPIAPRAAGTRRPSSASDVLGEPWVAETIGLPPDDEGPVVATLVSPRAERPNGRAVLHVHGFADYFFQTEYAAGGSSAATTSTPSTCASTAGRSGRTRPRPTSPTCASYFAEIDLAWWRITERDGHDHVVVSAHSTGGLTAAVGRPPPARGAGRRWCSTRRGSTCRVRPGCARPPPAGRWTGSAGASRCGDPRATSPASTRAACTATTRASGTSTWPGSRSSRSRSGSAGCARSAAATPRCTPACRCSRRCWSCPRPRPCCPTEMGDDVHTHDIVLDVPQIRRWAPSVGRTSPTSPSTAPATTWCCRGPSLRAGLRRARPLGQAVRLSAAARSSRCSLEPAQPRGAVQNAGARAAGRKPTTSMTSQ